MSDSALFSVKKFRVKLYPRDFKKVRAFYEEQLHFQVTHEWDRDENDKGVMFDVGGTTLELLSPEHAYEPITGCALSLEVSDVRKLHETLKDTGCVVRGLKDNSWGDTSFRISDPEGFNISFFAKH